MNPHSRTRRFTVLMLLVLALASFARPVQADSSPPPPPSGSNPQPGQEQTQVRMLAETVTMQIAAHSNYPHGEAKVTAHFEMRNLGSQEEKMEVRFPLNSMWLTSPNQFQCIHTGHPPIRDLAVRVDQKPVKVRIETEKVEDTFRVPNQTELQYEEVPCWGHYWVTFPPGQDVSMDVSYTAQGGESKYAPNDRSQPFYYILETGAGWKDTIGQADIIVQAPFELNEQNLDGVYPAGSTLTHGNELRWHFENLEPTSRDNIYVTILEPDLWQAIQKARQQTIDNPASATAWANLAYAEHAAILLGYPFEDEAEAIPMGGILRNNDPGGQALINECKLAYQKAIERLPKNIELRLHYAKLLWGEIWGHFDDSSITQRLAMTSLEQIQAVLKIDPSHKKANAMLRHIAGAKWGNGVMINLSQPEPVYYLLTPLPSPTATSGPAPTQTPLPPATSTLAAHPSPSATMAPIQTQLLPTRAATEPFAGLTPTAAARADSQPGGWLWAGGLLVFASLALLVIRRRSRGL